MAELDDGLTRALDSKRLDGSTHACDFSSSSSYYSSTFDPFSGVAGVASALKQDIRACNIQSWWDIAAMEEEQERERLSPPTSGSQRAAADAMARTRARVCVREHFSSKVLMFLAGAFTDL